MGGGGAGFSAFVHHKSDMDWHWTEPKPLSNILRDGIARFVMSFDDRT